MSNELEYAIINRFRATIKEEGAFAALFDKHFDSLDSKGKTMILGVICAEYGYSFDEIIDQAIKELKLIHIPSENKQIFAKYLIDNLDQYSHKNVVFLMGFITLNSDEEEFMRYMQHNLDKGVIDPDVFEYFYNLYHDIEFHDSYSFRD